MRTLEDYGLRTCDGDRIALQGVRLTGQLRGLLFEAAVEQRFSNREDHHVEIVYTFPLPWQAVLLGVDVQMGERTLNGCVIEKPEAEARYEDALSDGDAAILLEQNPDHSYTLNLGNLAPGEEAVITLRYAQTLAFEGKGLRLLIPTVIAPRCGDPIRDGGLKPHQVVEHSLTADHPFEMAITLNGAFQHATIASPSHPIRDELPNSANGFVRTVSLSRRGALDRDFVLALDQLEPESLAVLARDAVEAEKVVVLASFCPHLPTTEPPPVSVKLLVDCSGSMNGDSIAAARRALHRIVDGLAPGDRFSLSRFGGTVEHRSRLPWKATECTQRAARRWIDDLQADLGGTEMENALMSTFGQGEDSAGDVLLVTDGEISAIDRTIVAAQHSGYRVFIVGIGSSPAESHLRRLAEATGGACDFVAPGEAVEPAVVRMFTRLRSPRLTNFSLRWPEGCTPLWQSPIGASVFNGDTVNVFALLDQVPVGNVCLYGLRDGAPHPEEIGHLRFESEIDDGTTLSRMAATVRVQEGERQGFHSAMAEVRRLSVAYQLLNAQTSFFLVHPRDAADKAVDMPVLRQVRPMLPAGWGGTGSVMQCLAVDYSALDVPAVCRKGRNDTTSKQMDPVADRYDIPAFLRRKPVEIDRQNEQYWGTTPEYTGLTPLGLADYLNRTARAQWPTTYAGLRQIGLGGGVVDWLELVIATKETGGAWPEATVVATFLTVMALPETAATLTRAGSRRPSIASLAQSLRGLFDRKAQVPAEHIEPQLANLLMAALDGLSAERWPDKVFALDGVEY